MRRFSRRFGVVADEPDLANALNTLSKTMDGRVGIGVQFAGSTRAVFVGVNSDQRFSLQSVMKLVVAAAVMDAVDQRGWKLAQPIVVRKQDLSLNVQPLADLVGKTGFKTTLGDLVFRAVVDSDSAASDILFARLGGVPAISRFLQRKQLERGIRVDRDERHLQTETGGLQWRPEFVDRAVLEQARKNVPTTRQAAAFRAYLKDIRDTATPQGMTAFLYKLANGTLLSPSSTRHLLGVMVHTATFPDRLKAGVPVGWTIAHKTGTSGTWEGMNAVTNDVGILTAPDKRPVAVSVFVAESRRPSAERAAFIAQVARLVTAAVAEKRLP